MSFRSRLNTTNLKTPSFIEKFNTTKIYVIKTKEWVSYNTDVD